MSKLTSHGPADLLALDSPPNARFPRRNDLLGPAYWCSTLHYGMPWSLKDFPIGRWFREFDCLEKIFMPDLEGKSQNLAIDLTFGVKPMIALHDARESLLGPERVMEFRIRMLMQLSWSVAWAQNVAVLRQKLEGQRYAALVLPSGASYRPLITLRRAVARTRSSIVSVRDNVRPQMEEAFQKLHGDPEWTLREMYEPLLTEIDDVNKELNEDIQLIIGAVTIQDSDAMKMQAERATLLTSLAAIYLPLTLVTGIFGMNIKEINDGIPSFKACIGALAVAAVATAVFVISYSRWKRWQKTQEQRRRRKEVVERKDLEAVFERASSYGTYDGDSTSRIDKAVEVIRNGWEAPKAAVSKVVKRKRRASPGISLELGRRR